MIGFTCFRIIGELKYECTSVTDKLEEAARSYANDKVSKLKT